MIGPDVKDSLARAVESVLRPFARRLLSHGKRRRRVGQADTIRGVVKRAGPFAVAVYAAMAAAGVLWLTHQRNAIDTWYLFDLLRWWAGAGLVALATLSAGRRALEYCGARTLRIRSRWAVAVAVGLPLFVGGEWAAGAVGLLNSPFAVGWALALAASGATLLRTDFTEWRRRTARSSTTLEKLALIAGVLLVGWLYLGVLTPDAVNYDAKWNHLVIAENYAREHRVFGFTADWNRNMPHLGSMVSTWAFLWPGATLPPQQWVQALHLEFVFFCFTLLSVTAVLELLWPRRAPMGAWAVALLFPAISVYDNNLGGSSDHYVAFFACPLLLATVWAARVPRWPRLAVFGAIAGGIMATKLQGFYLVVPAGLWLLGALLSRLRRIRDVTVLSGLIAAALGFAFSFGPHALRNLIAFGNPLYPAAQNLFGGTPTVANAHELIMNRVAHWPHHAPHALGEKLTAALSLIFTFHFGPHYSFVNNVPVFGALFTLVSPLLPFFAATRRSLAVLFCAWGALAAWALTYWVDRNLQTFAPLLWAAAAASLVALWRSGLAARAAAVAFVAAQLVTGTDMVFTASDRVNSAVALLRSTYDGKGATRFAAWGVAEQALAKKLPPQAVVVLHTDHLTLGLQRRTLLDWAGFQGLIDYRPLKSIADVERTLVAAGGTHLLMTRCLRPAATRQEEVLFALYAAATEGRHQHDFQYTWWPLGQATGLNDKPLNVLVHKQYPYVDAVYRVDQLTANYEMPPSWQVPKGAPLDPQPGPSEIDAVITEEGKPFPPQLTAADFVRVHACQSSQIFARRTLFARMPQGR